MGKLIEEYDELISHLINKAKETNDLSEKRQLSDTVARLVGTRNHLYD